MKSNLYNNIINAINNDNNELLDELELTFALGIFAWHDAKYKYVYRDADKDVAAHICLMHINEVLRIDAEDGSRVWKARNIVPEDDAEQREIALLLMNR